LGLGSGLSWPFFFLSYGLFQLALCSFLAINMAVVAQLVGESGRRGALLGVVNLANTVPAVLAPALVVASLDSWLLRGRLELFFLAAAAAAAFAILPVLGIRRAA
jgi:MFS family permease